MSRRVLIAAIVLLVGVAALAGCSPSVPSSPPSIAGRIMTVTPTLGANSAGPASSGTMLVEGTGAIGDKASLTVSGTTPVLRQIKDGTVTSAAFADLQPGLRVSVWMDGPVAESYPVQAAASVVLIVE